jgi:hypothetical protein
MEGIIVWSAILIPSALVGLLCGYFSKGKLGRRWFINVAYCATIWRLNCSLYRSRRLSAQPAIFVQEGYSAQMHRSSQPAKRLLTGCIQVLNISSFVTIRDNTING